jgi:hypothetical protein
LTAWFGWVNLELAGDLFQRAPLIELSSRLFAPSMKAYSKKRKITTRPEISFVRRAIDTKK